jgi:hypothetical protein
MVTATYEGLYVNYVRDSNSIFRHAELSSNEAMQLALIDYPEISDTTLDVDAILMSPQL